MERFRVTEAGSRGWGVGTAVALTLNFADSTPRAVPLSKMPPAALAAQPP